MSHELDAEKLKKIMQALLQQLDGLTEEESTNVLLNLKYALKKTSIVQADRCKDLNYETSLRPARGG